MKVVSRTTNQLVVHLEKGEKEVYCPTCGSVIECRDKSGYLSCCKCHHGQVIVRREYEGRYL